MDKVNPFTIIRENCRYASAKSATESEAIAAHNRVAKAAGEEDAK